MRAFTGDNPPAPGNTSARVGITRPWLQRLARWWLSQLLWMVPQRQQPVRAAALARCAVQLLRLLPAAPPGTRVLAPEVLWQAAQGEADAEAVFTAWLHPAGQ